MRAEKTESDYAKHFLCNFLLSARQIINIIIILSLFLFIVFKFYLKIRRKKTSMPVSSEMDELDLFLPNLS